MAVQGDQGVVTRVVDGDTLDVEVNGIVYRVRIIGVDTPETVAPGRPVDCYGSEATAKAQELIDRADGRVILEKDVSETDRYARVLRYVWLLHPDGQRMLNYELVAAGYAQVSTYPPDVKYTDMFLAAQREAREQGRGLWTACGDDAAPAETPSSGATADGVEFVAVHGASPGGTASVTVLTAPGATCSITYVTPRGTVSSARGLEPRTAGGDGSVSWSWNIGSSTQPGTGSVTVTCGGQSTTSPITIS